MRSLNKKTNETKQKLIDTKNRLMVTSRVRGEGVMREWMTELKLC